ncbi:MAG: M20/M25/M40 family metallo-hydrolase [Saprospirales bacterium]|nr:MAG: M20/M25/M40 family metallo-hydrolase [Saprospirales bacterium]
MRYTYKFLMFIGLFLPVLGVAQTGELANDLKEHVRILASPEFEGRGLGTDGIEMARTYIEAQFEEAGLEQIGDSYFHDFKIRIGLAWVPGRNIVGKIPGSDPELRDEVIVIGAHYDHLGYAVRDGQKVIYHGADDNASGTATLMELAHYFSANRENLGRTIVFVAFDAEESGLWGARWFLRDSLVAHDQIRTMFSLDMVGMYEEYGGLDLKGMGTLAGGVDMAKSLAETRGINLKNTGAQIERRTDTWPFGSIGVPAIHAFTGLVSPYHQPEDTYDLLDYEGMAEIKWFLADLVAEMSTAEDLEPSDRFLASTRREDGRVVEIRRPFFEYGISLHNGSGFHRHRNEFFRARSSYNFAGGLFAQFNLSNRFTLQPEVLYDYNGSKWEEGSFRRHSVTVPLNVQFNFAQIENEFRAFLFAGGYYRYNFGGKVAGESIDYDAGFEDTEFGINFGIGVEIIRLHLGWTMRRGMTDLNQDGGSLGSIRDVNSLFTVGVTF